MTLTEYELNGIKGFLSETSRGILMTRRRDGTIQSSPMVLGADDEGNLLFSTRVTTVKVRHLKRDPYAAVCIITDKFLGPWLQVEGTTEVLELPAALPGLRAFYAGRGAQDTAGDEFRERMETEQRCLLRVRVTRVVEPPARRTARAAS
jgi:PPOX class probable F420-dependent enzyme